MSYTPTFQFALRSDIEDICLSLPKDNKILPDDFLPCQADPEATGYDVRCAAKEGVYYKAGGYMKIPLGIRVYAPTGWWLDLAPRSSTFMKKHIHPLYGKIDETFEHEILFVCQYIPPSDSFESGEFKHIEFGERIAQLIPVRREVMIVRSTSNNELEKLYNGRNSSRIGGLGSSGKY